LIVNVLINRQYFIFTPGDESPSATNVVVGVGVVVVAADVAVGVLVVIRFSIP